MLDLFSGYNSKYNASCFSISNDRTRNAAEVQEGLPRGQDIILTKTVNRLSYKNGYD